MKATRTPRPFPFTTWIGIDQTGAVLDGGHRARPLPAVVGRVVEGEARFWIADGEGRPLRLASLLPASLDELLRATDERAVVDAGLALVVDCVLGLPEATSGQGLWTWFEAAASVPSPAFGRARAEAFFQTVLRTCPVPREGVLPRRRVEELASANSVFASRPFQKNIQTGTYRFWRELGLGARSRGGRPWLSLWPFDAPGELPLVMEGFPSWMWKRIFGCTTRDASQLRGRLKEAFREEGLRLVFKSRGGGGALLAEEKAWDCLQGDPDLCDALVLAAGGILLHRRGALLDPEVRAGAPRGEGWIAGVPFPEAGN